MRKKIPKKIYMFCLTVIFFGIIVIPYLPGQAIALQKLINSPNQNSSNLTITDKDNSSPETSSYLMLNVRTEEKLLAANEDVKRAPASTVKLLTGMVVMDKLRENDLIRVGEEVKNTEGSVIGLQSGDQILVKDLLTALYLESANDAAVVLAIAAYGTMDAFLNAMNQFADKIGSSNSLFKTPNGLPHPDQFTTAHDLSLIAVEFISKEELMKYVKMKEGTVEWTRSSGYKQKKLVKNTNQLLAIYPGDIGLKTGTTTEAGQCLVTYITRPDGDVLLVLLGSKQRYKDTIELLDLGMAKIRTRSALKNITSHPDSLIYAPGFYVP